MSVPVLKGLIQSIIFFLMITFFAILSTIALHNLLRNVKGSNCLLFKSTVNGVQYHVNWTSNMSAEYANKL